MLNELLAVVIGAGATVIGVALGEYVKWHLERTRKK